VNLAEIEPKVKEIATCGGTASGADQDAGGRPGVADPEQLQKLKQIGHQMRPMMVRNDGTASHAPGAHTGPAPFGTGMPHVLGTAGTPQ